MDNLDIMDDVNTECVMNEIMNAVSKSIKTEIHNYKQKIYLKHKEKSDETNKAILSIPLVKQLIYSYEDKLLNSPPFNQELHEHKVKVDTELTEIKEKIDKIEKMLQDIISSKPVKQEENIVLKIEESDHAIVSDVLINVLNTNSSSSDSSEEEEQESDDSSEEEEQESDDSSEEESEQEEHDDDDDEDSEEEEEKQELEKQEQELEEQEIVQIKKIDVKFIKIEAPDNDLETENSDNDADAEEEEEEELTEIEIDDVTYFTTNEENGIIYESDKNGEPGKKIGKMVNGEAIFS